MQAKSSSRAHGQAVLLDVKLASVNNKACCGFGCELACRLTRHLTWTISQIHGSSELGWSLNSRWMTTAVSLLSLWNAGDLEVTSDALAHDLSWPLASGFLNTHTYSWALCVLGHMEDLVPTTVIHLFQELPDSLKEQTHLKEWHINHTLIETIPTYIKLFQAMRILDLPKNQISHLPAEIGMSLSRAQDSGEQAAGGQVQLPWELLPLPPQEVTRQGRPCSALPELFGPSVPLGGDATVSPVWLSTYRRLPDAQNLEVSWVSDAVFRNFSFSFGHSDSHFFPFFLVTGCLKNLKELNVSFNHLKSIPPELGECENLEKLDCSGNLELTELPFEVRT